MTGINRQSTVSLRQITAATVRAVLALDVAPLQRGYVATNAVSLAEAHFNPGSWFRAIYADEEPVGFLMLFNPTAPGAIERAQVERDEIVLWRFMIDARFQRLGFGRSALDLVCTHAREGTRAVRLLTSYVEGPNGPAAFYRSYGYAPTGRRRAGGTEVEIALAIGAMPIDSNGPMTLGDRLR